MEDVKLKALAKIVHEANKAFCEVTGDNSLLCWEDTPDEIKESAVLGVKAVVENPAITSKELHDKWALAKYEDGWVYGDEKDETKKTHPCLIEYEDLSVAQRFKDALFLSIVLAYLNFKKSAAENTLENNDG